jgi:signal transduction histidine kinase
MRAWNSLVLTLGRLTSPVSPGAAVLRFAVTGFVVLALVGLGGVEVLRRVGRTEAIRDSREVTALAGEGIVAPAITPAVLRGDPSAIAQMDTVVRRRVLRPPVVRVKLWDPDGRIVYSDEHRLIGTVYADKRAEVRASRFGAAEAEVSDLSGPESRYERRYGKLMEVYLGVRGPRGERLLFETYQRYSSVTSSGRRLWLNFLPVLLGALGLLAFLQVPLAWSLARRVSRAERERLRLLERSIDAQQQERRRIAGDLHDGVVQTLAGISYRLGAAAGHVDASTPPALATAIDASARETRESIRELRSLLVDIYPPSLEREGLEAALRDLMTRASNAQLRTSLELPADLQLSPVREALMFRGAQEALRNVVAHAGASNVTISVVRENGTARLTVADDGRGFDPSPALAGRNGGHFGLRALDDLVRDQGGTLTVDSRLGAGTRVSLEVPAE